MVVTNVCVQTMNADTSSHHLSPNQHNVSFQSPTHPQAAHNGHGPSQPAYSSFTHQMPGYSGPVQTQDAEPAAIRSSFTLGVGLCPSTGRLTLMTHVDFCCWLLLSNLAVELLLHVCHGLLLSCTTSCATKIWIATCSICATSCGKRWALSRRLLFVYLSLCTETDMLRVFSRCSVHPRVQMLRLRLLAFSYIH